MLAILTVMQRLQQLGECLSDQSQVGTSRCRIFLRLQLMIPEHNVARADSGYSEAQQVSAFSVCNWEKLWWHSIPIFIESIGYGQLVAS